MAYGVEPARASALAQFIYVWPSQELMSRSWSWPASWHLAFQDAASRLGLAVAFYGLDGRRFTRRLVSLQLSIGSVGFRIKHRGTSIVVTVSDFTASVSRGPDDPDGTRQPGAVGGLVLGLHGTDKGCYLAVFHGHMPPLPVGAPLPSGRPGVQTGRSRRTAGDGEGTDSGSGIRASPRRAEAVKSGKAARGKTASGRKTDTAAGQSKEQQKWSALVWRTHTGSLAMLPLHGNAPADRWLEIDGALLCEPPSWLLH